MARDGLTRQEAFAGAVLAHHLNCDAPGAEDGRTPGMVDLWLVRDGVTFGAAEVTIASDQDEMRTESAAASQGGPQGWEILSTRSRWVAHYTAQTRIQGAEALLQSVITLCDLHGVDKPDRLPLDVRLDSVLFDEYRRAGWDLLALPRETSSTPAEGIVYVVRRWMGAFIPDGLDGLVDWVDRELDDRWRPKVDKLHDLDVVERHLVIVCHISGPPPEVILGASPSVLPDRAPIDVGLSGLWLLLPFGQDLLRWTPGDGWEWLTLPP